MRRLLCKLALLSCGCLVVVSLGSGASAQAAGNVYYVSPGGSAVADGQTPGAAFATIQKALDVAPSGSTIHLAAGRYLQDAVTRRDGVTVTGPADAVVQGGGGSRIWQIRHDRVTLSGFAVDGLAGSPNDPGGYRDKLIYVMSSTAGDGVSGLRIRGMRLENAGGECLRLRYLVTGAEVSGNRVGPCGVYDFAFPGGGKNGEGIYLGTAPEQQGANGAPDARSDVSSDNTVQDNVIDTQGNECVDIKENSTANVVQRNLCTGQRDPESAGFDARGSSNVFRFNVAYGNNGAGLRFGGDTAADGTGNDAYGNIITGNAAGGIKFQATPQGQVCGNVMTGNTGGDSVGRYAGQFAPANPCY